MNHQSKCMPMEIFGLIAAESSDEVLKNIRLTCHAGREIATPLLFKCFKVQAINCHTLKRLQEVARRPQLACFVKKFEYQPRIRTSSHGNEICVLILERRLTFLDDDERRQLTEQNNVLASSAFAGALVAALKSFTQLGHVELQYPPFGMRRECNSRGLCVLAEMIRNIISNICPRLVSLSIAGLLLVDIPQNLLQATGDDMGAALTTVERLDLDFHPGDMPSGEMMRIKPDGLRRMLSLVPNLTSLRIKFHLLDRSMRSFDWSVLQCNKLNTLELVQLEMSETSLMNMMTQNAHSIRKLILEGVYLFDGTWAAIYDRIANTEGINDISQVQGRRYSDGHGSHTELDTASYRRLFATVEKRRESQGLPSTKWPTSRLGFVMSSRFFVYGN
ncbi:hypothetical protein MKX08_002497 [Trichoderma sp. CBMAI-0020]|nr:hypothetical protein MKX08_002497 [Trichoderma sp. CBMAI-0020]